MGPGIRWVRSYVTDDKIYCVYFANDAGLHSGTREEIKCRV